MPFPYKFSADQVWDWDQNALPRCVTRIFENSNGIPICPVCTGAPVGTAEDWLLGVDIPSPGLPVLDAGCEGTISVGMGDELWLA